MIRWLAFGAILVLAATLRFWALSEQGILAVDEGRYILDGLSKYDETRAYADIVRAHQAERSGGPPFLLAQALPGIAQRLHEHPPYSPKLLYNYMTACVMAVTGYTVWACNVVEGIGGLLMILATWALVRSLAGNRAALIAAGALAVSAYHIYYSRNGYPQTASAIFVVLAVMAHWRGERKARATHDPDRSRMTRDLHNAFAGAMAGFSFWANYQSAGALPLLAVAHLCMCACGGSSWNKIARFARGGVMMALGFAAVIALAEAVTYPAVLLFRGQGLAYPHATFLELLIPRLTAQTSVGYNWSGVLLLPYFLWLFEGSAWVAAVVALGVLAVVVRLRRNGPAPRPNTTAAGPYERFVYLAVTVAVPYFVFSLKTMQGARMFVYVLPFLAGLIGVAADTLLSAQGGRRKTWIAVTAILLTVGAASSLYHDREVLATRSAYPEVMRYAQERQNVPVYAAWSAVLDSYLYASGHPGGALGFDTGEGPALYVSDWQELYYGNYPDQPNPLADGVVPVAEFENNFGRIFLATEAFPSYGWTPWSIRWAHSLDLDRARKVLIYDLRTAPRRPASQKPLAHPELWLTFPEK